MHPTTKKIKQKFVCETALNRLHLFSKLSNDELSYDVLRVEWTLSLNISNEMNVDWHNSEIILCSKSILKPYIIKFRFLFHCHRQIITVRIFHTNVWHCLVVSTSKNQTLPNGILDFVSHSHSHTHDINIIDFSFELHPNHCQCKWAVASQSLFEWSPITKPIKRR